MNTISNYSSPSFGMKVVGLEHRYFDVVPKKIKDELITKAQNCKKDFTVEFVPTDDNWVFLKKVTDNFSKVVDYFPSQYTPREIVNTFIKAFIPDYRLMSKSLVKETNSQAAQNLYKKHSNI